MREESHLEDMRSAIRGDFERLARRRGGQDLLQVEPAGPEPEDEPSSEAPSDALPVPPPEAGPGLGDGERPRGSWLDRILGR